MPGQEPRVKLPPADQVGIVVKDMDKAIDFYSSNFGWGPFQVRQAELKGIEYRGKKGDVKLKLGFARSGQLEVELIQVMEGETPHTDFLKANGEGIHHLRFLVQDLDGMLAELARGGVKPVWQQRSDRVAFAYLNTDQTGGVMFELLEQKAPPNVR